MIDLHMHSVYSDGSSTVEEIIDKAVELGLTQIAITDHNTIEGSILGKKISPIEFIVGTELSVGYHNKEVHLLGYFPHGSDYKNVNFVISEGEIYKKMATMEMIENLNAMGIDIEIGELKEFAKGIINRVHICKVLQKKGYVSSVAEGFKNYVGNHCPAYVERKTVDIAEACEAIHCDGGIAVIAHPYEYDEVGDIDDFLNDIASSIDGIECFHPSATNEQSLHLKDIAEKNGLIITGGSDYHGENKPDISINQMKVDDIYKISC